MRSQREKLELAARPALVLAGVILALLIAEAGLRVGLWRLQSRQSIARLGESGEKIRSTHPLAEIVRRSADPEQVFELQPNLDVVFGPVRVRTNRLGMRQDRDYPEARSPRSVRIAGIGDSGMFGWDVAQDETYLARLEANLNRRGDGVTYEVLNLAVPGYNTQLELQSLLDKGLTFRPDVVIVGWCDNDFHLPYFIPQEGQWTRLDISLLWHLLFDRKHFADLVFGRISDQREYDKTRVPQRFQEGALVEGVRRAFARIKQLGEERGFKVLVFGGMRREEIREILNSLAIPYFDIRARIPPDR